MTETHETHVESKREGFRPLEDSVRVLSSGSLGSAFLAVAASILAILGLAAVSPAVMAAVAATAVGCGFLWEGAALKKEFRSIVRDATYDSRMRMTAGMGALGIGGAAGIVLGALAIAGIHPAALVAVCALVFGATLMGSALATYGIEVAMPWKGGRPNELLPGAVVSATGFQLLAGISAIVLGIIALATLATLVLDLVAMLCVAASVLWSGTAVSARLFRSY